MDAERVRWWHGAIFARHFPHDGGRFRKERAFFGVVTAAGGMRQLEGISPETLRRDLEAVCVAFNQRLEHLRATAAPEFMDCTRAVGALYAGILRVHPFADGNHRVSFVVLSAALWSLGLPNVDFLWDDEVRVRDEVLAPALSSSDGSIEPFARLLTDLIEGSTAPGP